MKTFIVQGSNWFTQIEVDNELIDKEIDLGCEAATQAIELYLLGEDNLAFISQISTADDTSPALGPFMIVHEDGREDDAGEEMIFLTEYICRNAGKHALADTVNELVQKHYKSL
jgi:hypothetical protein